MNMKNVWRPGGENPIVAVAIARMPPGNTHVGIVYRLGDEGDEAKLLHLAFHKRLVDDPVESLRHWPRQGGNMLCIVPGIEDLEQVNVAIMCRGIARDHPELPYGLIYNEDGCFEIVNGKYDLALPDDRRWLNCSTFALTVFKSTGAAIINAEDWPDRPTEDEEWQKMLVEWLGKVCDSEHLERIRPAIGKARIRPEETAGACLEDELPAQFVQCEPNGHLILELIDGNGVASTQTEAG